MSDVLMTLAQAHALLPGSTLVGDGQTPLLRVHTDTRSLAPGDIHYFTDLSSMRIWWSGSTTPSGAFYIQSIQIFLHLLRGNLLEFIG